MIKKTCLLLLTLFSLTANAQFTYQGATPISETLDLNVSNVWTKNLIFKNNGNASAYLVASLAGLDASKFKISINRCSTTATAKGKTCQVTIESSRGLAKKLDPYIVQFDSVSINLTVTDSTAPPVTNEPAPSISSFSFTPDTAPLVEFASGELNKSITLIIKNTGDQAETPSLVIDSAGSLNLTYLINRCTTSVAVSKTCSVQLRVNNPPDSNVQSKLVKVFVGGIEKDSILISASQTNLCVANSKKVCSTANSQSAVQTCALDGKSYGQCIIESCSNNFFLSSNQCLPITYSATFSEYNPFVPQNQVACDGTVISTRTISECKRTHDDVIVNNSFCSDDYSQINSQSPAGNKIVSISNGSETYSCPVGSNVQSFISRNCNSGFTDNGLICAAANGTPVNVVSSGSSTCSITTDGGAYCWGLNSAGQLGNGALLSTSIPILSNYSGSLIGKTLKTVVLSGGFGCGIANDDLAYCWGSNSSGQLGNGTLLQSDSPVAVNTSGVLSGKTIKQISSKGNFVCVIASDDNAYCWGSNWAGQLGNASSVDSSLPVAVNRVGVLSGKTIKSVSSGLNHACAIASDDNVYCWGAGTSSQLGNGASANSNIPVAVSTSGVLSGKTIKSVSSNNSVSCVIASDDQVYCWGLNNIGQLGNGASVSSNIPVAVSTSGVLNGKIIKSISSGGSTNCAIANDDLVYCWGLGTSGQLGNGANATSNIPVAVSTSGVLSGKTIKKIASSSSTTCAIANDDLVYCWGNNSNGQLGNNATANSNIPVAVSTSGVLSGKTIKDVSENGTATCSIAIDDKLYCWGINSTGQLMVTSTALVKTPTKVLMNGALTGKTIKSLSLGTGTTCGIASDDLAYCWGSGTGGSLGNNDGLNSTVPVAVSTSGVLSGKTIKALSTGSQHTCVIASDDKVYCWGLGTSGQLGNNSNTNSNIPVAVISSGVLLGKTIVEISAAGSFSCALSSDGLAYCWGQNNLGQLGNGTYVNSFTPVSVNMSGALSGKSIVSIDSGNQHTCVKASNGLPYCWGRNDTGQLGNGNTQFSTDEANPYPVYVSGSLAGKTIKEFSSGAAGSCVIASDDMAYCWGLNSNGANGNGISSGFTDVPVSVTTSGVLSGLTLSKITVGNFGGCALATNNKVYCWGFGTSGQLGNGSILDSTVPVETSPMQ